MRVLLSLGIIGVLLLQNISYALYYDPVTGAYRLGSPAEESETQDVSKQTDQQRAEALLTDITNLTESVEGLIEEAENEGVDNGVSYDTAEENYDNALLQAEDALEAYDNEDFENAISIAEDVVTLLESAEELLEEVLSVELTDRQSTRGLIRELEERRDYLQEVYDAGSVEDKATDSFDESKNLLEDTDDLIDDAWDAFFAERYEDIQPLYDEGDDYLDKIARYLDVDPDYYVIESEVESDDAEESTDDSSDEESADEDEPVEVVDSDWKRGTYSGPLEYLHIQLDDHTESSLQLVTERFADLQDEADDVFSDSPSSRVKVLKCLDVIDADRDLKDQIITTYNELITQIEIDAADMHSEIGALEQKISQELLSELMQNINISSIQNKVDAFLVEYKNAIDMFIELSSDDALSLDELIDEAKEENQQLVENYDERLEMFKDLEDEYDNFLKKSSFSSVLAGPNMYSLLNLVAGLETYYRSLLLTEWQEKVASYIPSSPLEQEALEDEEAELLKRFTREFNVSAEGLLGDLYPVESMHLLHKSMLSLRASYITDGVPNCTSLATNPTLDVAADDMKDRMDTILKDLNAAANEVATDEGELPTNLVELKKGVVEGLSDELSALISEVLNEYRNSLKQKFEFQGLTWLSVPVEQGTLRWERLVRVYLQNKYIQAVAAEETDEFNEMMQLARQKIETVFKERDPQGTTRSVLIAIQNIIQEFVQ